MCRLLFAKNKQDDLEAARQSAVDANSAVKDEKNTRQLSDFLQKYAKEKPVASKDGANQQTVGGGNGETIVHRIELEHR